MKNLINLKTLQIQIALVWEIKALHAYLWHYNRLACTPI